MDYQRTIAVSGDAQKAFDYAQTVFAQNNFSVKKIGSDEVELAGPGMNNTRENPITGVGRARMKRLGSKLKLEAQLGGVKKMQWFLIVFPLGLGLFLFTLFYFQHQSVRPALPALYAVSPWIVIGPFMGRWIKSRTTKALDVVLENAAQQ